MCINTLEKREFGEKTAFSTAEEMSLFPTESQKMRGNEFGRGAWVLGHLESQNFTNSK